MNKITLLTDLGMIYPNENSKQKKRYGIYKCFCGKEFKAQTYDITSKNTSSCGCNKGKVIHNLTNHRLYNIWKLMTSRCRNSKYTNYNGRGITVCDRWLDVSNFIEDMYPTYREGLSIDRIDNNGNYEPSNCRWTTAIVQARNTRKIRCNNKSGYRGVVLNKNKWQSQITVNRKCIYLGIYDTALEAAKAYDKYIDDNELEHTKNNL